MDSDRTPAVGFARYAREFHNAAITVDDTMGTKPGYELIAPIPAQFLAAHSIELANAIFEYLEIFHNRRRRHSSLGMVSPVEYELRHAS